MNPKDAVRTIQARAQYIFFEEEFAALTGHTPDSPALASALARLSKSGEIVSLGRQPGGWLIVPPEYRHYGAPPIESWLGPWLTRVDAGGYMGLLSAARAWGSSHYGLQHTQVIVPAARRPLVVGRSHLVFFTKKDAASTPVVRQNTPRGLIKISSREATLLDLLQYQSKVGGVEAVSRAARDFRQALTANGLREALTAMDNVSAAQRLGFIFECLSMPRLASVVERWLTDKHVQRIRLAVGSATPREVSLSERWRLDYSELDLLHLDQL